MRVRAPALEACCALFAVNNRYSQKLALAGAALCVGHSLLLRDHGGEGDSVAWSIVILATAIGPHRIGDQYKAILKICNLWSHSADVVATCCDAISKYCDKVLHRYAREYRWDPYIAMCMHYLFVDNKKYHADENFHVGEPPRFTIRQQPPKWMVEASDIRIVSDLLEIYHTTKIAPSVAAARALCHLCRLSVAKAETGSARALRLMAYSLRHFGNNVEISRCVLDMLTMLLQIPETTNYVSDKALKLIARIRRRHRTNSEIMGSVAGALLRFHGWQISQESSNFFQGKNLTRMKNSRSWLHVFWGPACREMKTWGFKIF
eukprot:GHVP01055394.1.p2 GENE.GHVP01055394.1~~GHVP01055394.1.p2  ORF type:complete len:320 (+),score=40.48 GHVP01055394.1:2603-3562(+)